MKIKVLVIGRADDKRAQLHAMLDTDSLGSAAQVKSGPMALEKVESMDPDVAVILHGAGETDAFAIC